MIEKTGSFAPYGLNIPKEAPVMHRTKEDNQQVQNDTVSISTGSHTGIKTPETDVRAISLEKIDTALEAASTPIGDPGLLSVVLKALDAKKNLAASGTVTQGSTRYNVEFSLKNNEKDNPIPPEGIISTSQMEQKGYDYSLSGKMGQMEMKLHCYQSGLSLIIDGNIGANRVDLKNSYNLLTGKITTKGTMGQVPLNFTSKTDDKSAVTEGTIGGEKFYEKITTTSTGATATGKLGNLSLSGSSTEVSTGRFQTTNRIGDVETSYQLALTK